MHYVLCLYKTFQTIYFERKSVLDFFFFFEDEKRKDFVFEQSFTVLF